MFLFNPKWDMHWLRAKEIKDSLNSQTFPKILVLLKKSMMTAIKRQDIFTELGERQYSHLAYILVLPRCDTK